LFAGERVDEAPNHAIRRSTQSALIAESSKGSSAKPVRSPVRAGVADVFRVNAYESLALDRPPGSSARGRGDPSHDPSTQPGRGYNRPGQGVSRCDLRHPAGRHRPRGLRAPRTRACTRRPRSAGIGLEAAQTAITPAHEPAVESATRFKPCQGVSRIRPNFSKTSSPDGTDREIAQLPCPQRESPSMSTSKGFSYRKVGVTVPPIELFLAGVRVWEPEIRRLIGASSYLDDGEAQAQRSARCMQSVNL